MATMSHLVPAERFPQEVEALVRQMATGPTRAYATMRAMLKAWSNGGVAAADAVMLDLTMDLFSSEDATKGFAGTATRWHGPTTFSGPTS